MSQQSRRELIAVVAPRYQQAQGPAREQILNEFVASTGYHRTSAIQMLIHPPQPSAQGVKRPRKRHYSLPVQQALVTCWRASNGICSKRLVPYLPELVSVLEHHDELHLDEQTKAQLLTLSPATADRLLKQERDRFVPHGLGTRHSGNTTQRADPHSDLRRLG